MKKIICAMQVSLDGFVEGPSGELDWIENWEDSYGLMAQTRPLSWGTVELTYRLADA